MSYLEGKQGTIWYIKYTKFNSINPKDQNIIHFAHITKKH